MGVALFVILVAVAIIIINEVSTALTLGVTFVKDDSIILQLLVNSKINSVDNKIISVLYSNHPILANCICDSCSSLLSRYYIDTRYGVYRVLRGSKGHKYIKDKFKEVGKNVKPSF